MRPNGLMVQKILGNVLAVAQINGLDVEFDPLFSKEDRDGLMVRCAVRGVQFHGAALSRMAMERKHATRPGPR